MLHAYNKSSNVLLRKLNVMERLHCARQTLLPYLNCHDSCVHVLDDGVPAAGSRSQAWAASGGTTGAAASRSAQHLTALRALLVSGTHCGAEAKSNFPMVANTLSVPQEVDVHTSFVSKLHPVLATVFLCTSVRVQSRAPVLIQTALASSCLVMSECGKRNEEQEKRCGKVSMIERVYRCSSRMQESNG